MAIKSVTAVPQWEKSCWIVAISEVLGVPDERVKKVAKQNGWDGQSFGLSIQNTIATFWQILGRKPNFLHIDNYKHLTPKEFSGTTQLNGLVFTKGHVMPMQRGRVSNFNGHGEDPVLLVVYK